MSLAMSVALPTDTRWPASVRPVSCGYNDRSGGQLWRECDTPPQPAISSTGAVGRQPRKRGAVEAQPVARAVEAAFDRDGEIVVRQVDEIVRELGGELLERDVLLGDAPRAADSAWWPSRSIRVASTHVKFRGADRFQPHLQSEPRSILPAPRRDRRRFRSVGVERDRDGLGLRSPYSLERLRQQIFHLAADQFLSRVAELVFRAAIDQRDGPARVDQEDAVRRRLNRQLQQAAGLDSVQIHVLLQARLLRLLHVGQPNQLARILVDDEDALLHGHFRGRRHRAGAGALVGRR